MTMKQVYGFRPQFVKSLALREQRASRLRAWLLVYYGDTVARDFETARAICKRADAELFPVEFSTDYERGH